MKNYILYMKGKYIMTRLEYEICEACNNGEIDIDTRDLMLDIMESTSLQRNAKKKIDEIEKRQAEIRQKLKQYHRLLMTETNDDRKKKHYEMIDKLANEDDILEDERGKYYAIYRSKLRGDSAGQFKNSTDEITRSFSNVDIEQGKKAKEKTRRRYYSKGEDKLAERKAGRYAKESVDEMKMEIYERELNGEITAEERELLIGYMEATIDEE